MKTTRRPNRTALKSLNLRLSAQREELTTCTTAAMRKSVVDSILDTKRQIREAGERAEIAWGNADLRG